MRENGGIAPCIPKVGTGLLGVDECQFHASTILLLPPPYGKEDPIHIAGTHSWFGCSGDEEFACRKSNPFPASLSR